MKIVTPRTMPAEAASGLIYQLYDEKNQANGYCGLDSNGKVEESRLPRAGMVSYMGQWDADTNTPELQAAGPGNNGWYYVVSVEGTFNTVLYKPGDWIISNGSSWNIVRNYDAVTSVFGRTGPVVAADDDYTASQIKNLPQGGISATTVQAALNELDSDKAATGHDHSGVYEPANSNITTHLSSTNNPHSVTKDQVGLSNVTNDAQIPLAQRDAANGVCPLDAGAKVPEANLPDSVLGQVEYQGTWNAATNNPAIPAATNSNKGWYYIASTDVADTHGYTNVPAVDFKIGDWIISNGASWAKVDNTDAVPTVFGRVGNILAAAGDYTASQITNVAAGTISSTTVQAALNELDGDKVPYDRLGAVATGGTLDWNDSSNARPGSGYTLLYGNATNGPGPAAYYHSFCLEYSSKSGTGNLIQFAIPYTVGYPIYMRSRYNGTWSNWFKMWDSSTDGAGSGLDADNLDGMAPASLNTANTIVQRDASGNFAAGTITANITGNCSGSSGSCTGNAATATTATNVTATADATNASRYITFISGSTTGNYGAMVDSGLVYNPSTNVLTATVSGNATNVTGTVAIGNGGTGATTAAAARTNLALAFYDVAGCNPGKPAASATIWLFTAPRAFTIPAGATGSYAKARTAATASKAFTVYRNGTSIGTFTFAAAGTVATWSVASAVSVAAGDILHIVSPTQDTTLADLMWTIAGTY